MGEFATLLSAVPPDAVAYVLLIAFMWRRLELLDRRYNELMKLYTEKLTALVTKVGTLADRLKADDRRRETPDE